LSFEKIDQYIKELEAVKYYDKIKAENAALLARVKELEVELLSERRRLEELLKTIKELEEQVKVKDGEVESLRSELEVREVRIRELEERVGSLVSRVRELEELKVLVEGRTLKEAEEVFLRAKENEVRVLARNLFNQLKSEWEREGKPVEVMDEAIRWLKHTLEQLSKPGTPPLPKEIVESGLPEKVREILDSEVKRRVDAEFLRRVEERSEQKALEKLERLKSVEWLNWYKTVVEPRILQLEYELRSNAVKALKGPWLITCDRCGTTFQVELTADDVEDLLRKGSVAVECPNPNCLDTFFFIVSRHRIEITLKKLITSLVSETPY